MVTDEVASVPALTKLSKWFWHLSVLASFRIGLTLIVLGVLGAVLSELATCPFLPGYSFPAQEVTRVARQSPVLGALCGVGPACLLLSVLPLNLAWSRASTGQPTKWVARLTITLGSIGIVLTILSVMVIFGSALDND
jgi:hypothetical protein